MRTKAWLCIGTWFCLVGCGSDDGQTSPKDAAVEAGKKDVAPPNPDVADAPPLPADAPLEAKTPDAPTADLPQIPDAPATEARPSEGGQPIDAVLLPLDGGASEAGQSEVLPALFTSGPCKMFATSTSTAAPGTSLKIFDNQAGLDGLECIGWQRGSTGVQIDLFNFDGACGVDWGGDGAVAADGSVSLKIYDTSCMIACGICLFDWSFTLPAPLPPNQVEPVSVQVSSCSRSPTSTSSTTASVGPEKSGIRCTFAYYRALVSDASAKDLCGTAGMPCVGSSLCGSGGSSSTGTCDSGLVCDSSAAANEARCLTPCQRDTDCPRTDVWACTSGLCRPRGLSY